MKTFKIFVKASFIFYLFLIFFYLLPGERYFQIIRTNEFVNGCIEIFHPFFIDYSLVFYVFSIISILLFRKYLSKSEKWTVLVTVIFHTIILLAAVIADGR